MVQADGNNVPELCRHSQNSSDYGLASIIPKLKKQINSIKGLNSKPTEVCQKGFHGHWRAWISSHSYNFTPSKNTHLYWNCINIPPAHLLVCKESASSLEHQTQQPTMLLSCHSSPPSLSSSKDGTGYPTHPVSPLPPGQM